MLEMLSMLPRKSYDVLHSIYKYLTCDKGSLVQLVVVNVATSVDNWKVARVVCRCRRSSIPSGN